MPRYRYTSPWPEIFPTLVVGSSAEVFREGDAPPEGSTVLLQPGDELETTEPIEHAHLVPLDPAAPDGPKTDAPKES